MPRFRGSCGCYNRQDAREIGLAPAIVWNDMLDRAEHFDANPMWYDQKDAAERLGIPERSMNRAVEKLVEAGRITKRKGYRPGTTTTTTWVTIIEESVGGSRNDDLAVPRNDDLAVPILKETKERDFNNCEGKMESDVRMKPSVLFARMRTFFPRSRNDNRKKQIEAVERLQSEFDLSDETILDGMKALAKKGVWNIDGTEIPITLSALLLADDLNKTAKKLMVFAESGTKEKDYGGPRNVD